MPLSQNVEGVQLPTIYSDVNTRFSLNGRSELLTNYQDIRNSILNILNTQIGTRPWLRTYGSNIRRLLFDPVSPATARAIKLDTFQSIEAWEPRVQMDFHQTAITPMTRGAGYNANIYYYVPELEYMDNLMVNLNQA